MYQRQRRTHNATEYNASCRHPNLVELKKVVTGKKLDRCAGKDVCSVHHNKSAYVGVPASFVALSSWRQTSLHSVAGLLTMNLSGAVCFSCLRYAS